MNEPKSATAMIDRINEDTERIRRVWDFWEHLNRNRFSDGITMSMTDEGIPSGIADMMGETLGKRIGKVVDLCQELRTALLDVGIDVSEIRRQVRQARETQRSGWR